MRVYREMTMWLIEASEGASAGVKAVVMSQQNMDRPASKQRRKAKHSALQILSCRSPLPMTPLTSLFNVRSSIAA